MASSLSRMWSTLPPRRLSHHIHGLAEWLLSCIITLTSMVIILFILYKGHLVTPLLLFLVVILRGKVTAEPGRGMFLLYLFLFLYVTVKIDATSEHIEIKAPPPPPRHDKGGAPEGEGPTGTSSSSSSSSSSFPGSFPSSPDEHSNGSTSPRWPPRDEGPTKMDTDEMSHMDFLRRLEGEGLTTAERWFAFLMGLMMAIASTAGNAASNTAGTKASTAATTVATTTANNETEPGNGTDPGNGLIGEYENNTVAAVIGFLAGLACLTALILFAKYKCCKKAPAEAFKDQEEGAPGTKVKQVKGTVYKQVALEEKKTDEDSKKAANKDGHV